MNARALSIVAGVVGLSLAACAGTAVSSAPPSVRTTSGGRALVDAGGMILYTYDADARGISHCYGACAVAWPPAEAAAGANASGDFSIVSRAGGGRQWVYKGAPLYGYFLDTKPGEAAGDEAEGVWHIARP